MNSNRILLVAAVVLAVGAGTAVYVTDQVAFPQTADDTPTPGNAERSDLPFVSLPAGFTITIHAELPGDPRFMAFHDGTLYASIPGQDRVVALREANGSVDVATAVSGLNRPHGILFHDGWLYVASTDSVVRFPMEDGRADHAGRDVVVDGIPTGGHWTRTIQVFDGSLFISIGSSCNVCIEDHPWRAAILRCTLTGANCSVYASGLRNTVGFIAVNDTLIGTDNGRDWLGNDLPPDEINVIREGFYGWPYCYGDNTVDPAHDRPERCTDAIPAAVNLQAHSAPLGLAYYDDSAFPRAYRNELYVAYHGSWNRDPPTGYKVVRIPYDGGVFGEPQDFATGWLQEDGSNRGRPVDVVVGPEGALYVSDDSTRRIYRIPYTG